MIVSFIQFISFRLRIIVNEYKCCMGEINAGHIVWDKNINSNKNAFCRMHRAADTIYDRSANHYYFYITSDGDNSCNHRHRHFCYNQKEVSILFSTSGRHSCNINLYKKKTNGNEQVATKLHIVLLMCLYFVFFIHVTMQFFNYYSIL